MALGVRGNLEAELRRLRADLQEAQKHKADAEKRIASLARKNREVSETVVDLKGRVEELSTDKDALNALVASFQNMEAEFVQEMRKVKADYGLVIAELGKNKMKLEGALVESRKALSKSTEEAFGALESGYNLCWERAVRAGYDMEPHSFIRHCEDFARTREEGAGSADRADSAS